VAAEDKRGLSKGQLRALVGGSLLVAALLGLLVLYLATRGPDTAAFDQGYEDTSATIAVIAGATDDVTAVGLPAVPAHIGGAGTGVACRSCGFWHGKENVMKHWRRYQYDRKLQERVEQHLELRDDGSVIGWEIYESGQRSPTVELLAEDVLPPWGFKEIPLGWSPASAARERMPVTVIGWLPSPGGGSRALAAANALSGRDELPPPNKRQPLPKPPA
jgi:hypothetical protein